MLEKTLKRIGRPPEGRGEGGEPGKIRDYPKLLITIRPTVKATLKAIAEFEQRPAWRVVEDAITQYLEGMPTKARRVIANRACSSTSKRA